MVDGTVLKFMDGCRYELPRSRQPSASLAVKEQTVPDSIDLTVAIPTYNGSQRLPHVLDKLLAQVGISSITWEVIVADNNSRDDTAEVVKRYQQKWPENSSLRYTFVAEQGAAFARQRAVEIARGSIVAFLDDDNIPAETWVINVHTFAQTHPQAGAFGSQIHGDFEGPLPKELKPLSSFLAIVERGGQPHLYDPHKKILPPGAGLAVRRQTWLRHVPKRLFLNHKGKKAGLASEDLEAVLHIQKAGWEVWYNPEMLVYHKIPSSRLQADYMRSLLRCIGLSRFYIRMLGLRHWQRPLMVPTYIANDLRKLALHTLKSRQKPQSILDTCEREHLVSTLQSPFFIARKALNDLHKDLWENKGPNQRKVVRQIEVGFEENQFQLYQQPVFSLDQAKNTVTQYEVLLRLASNFQDSETGNILTPRVFMPVARKAGLANTLDRWVIRTLLRDSQTLQASQYSINLSLDTIHDQQFASFLDAELQRSQLIAKQLCFEVSENVIRQHPEAFQTLAFTLKEIGCQIAVDNLRNLAILKQITPQAVSTFKLSFLSQQGTKSKNVGLKRIRSSIHATAGMPLVALGIETGMMLNYIKLAGISHGQGYRLGKPEPLLFNAD